MCEPIKCVLHGSFTKNFVEIQRVAALFKSAGIEVLAPQMNELHSAVDGFGLFENEIYKDPRLVELEYLRKLKKLGANGFSYFVSTDGYIGKTTSYELGIAQLTNVRCFYSEKIADHPAYIYANAVWSPEDLVQYIIDNHALPPEKTHVNEKQIHKLWQELMVPGSVIATGAIIERTVKNKNEILLVKTHKWGDRYSIVGGKVKRNERLNDALLREVYEETGLDGKVGQHLLTFDQIKNSGYYQTGVQHVFVDNVVHVTDAEVRLNEEAQSYVWVPADEALASLDIEPNAQKTLELYAAQAY